MDPETLREILEDVRHDLGKHLPLPLRLLPPDADAERVREAARTALLRTRRGPAGATAAAALWAGLRGELCEALGDDPRDAGAAWIALDAAVDRALSWQDRLDGPLDRAALVADLGAVTAAVDAALDALGAVPEPLEIP